MQLKIDNASVTQLFTIVSSIRDVKIASGNQELVLVQIDEELKELRAAAVAVAVEVDRRVELLHEGSQEGLKELLNLQWQQQESARKISSAEMRKAGIETSLSLLDDEILMLQKWIDALLEGRKV